MLFGAMPVEEVILARRFAAMPSASSGCEIGENDVVAAQLRRERGGARPQFRILAQAVLNDALPEECDPDRLACRLRASSGGRHDQQQCEPWRQVRYPIPRAIRTTANWPRHARWSTADNCTSIPSGSGR